MDNRRPEKPDTVAVPVELLRELIDSANDFDVVNREAVKEARALIPRPKPRLVAVSFEQWGEIDDIRDLPDLLTLLDEIADSIGERWTVRYKGRPDTLSDDLKARIRTALGVSA